MVRYSQTAGGEEKGQHDGLRGAVLDESRNILMKNMCNRWQGTLRLLKAGGKYNSVSNIVKRSKKEIQ